MKKVLKQITAIGTAGISDYRSVRKVRFANILALTIMLFGMLFFVVNGVIRTEWARGTLTLILIPAGILIISLNHFKFYRAARSLVGFFPLLVCVFLPPLVHVISDHSALASPNEVMFPIIHAKMAAIASAVCPFVLLDLRNRVNQIAIPVVTVALVLLIDPLHLAVTPEVFENAMVSRELGVYNNFVMMAGVTVVLLCMFFVARLNIRYEDRMLEMLSELNAKSNKLKAEIDLRRISEMEMQAAKDKALGAVRSRTAFFAQMNHEIRTPLHGITALTAMLNETSDPVEKQKMQDSIQISTAELMRLLNNVLDLNKIESEKFDLKEQPFDPVEMLAKIKATYIKGIGSTYPSLEVEVYAGPSQNVIGDDLRISQVMHNLVVNAFKHGKATKVTIGFEILDQGSNEERILFYVADNGLGIGDEKVENMIEQGFEPSEFGTGNYGLGLFISQKILSQMDSRLNVASIPGNGSRFSFKLKLSRP